MKIGLYTLHSSHNVGAMLQTFALTKVLEANGHVVKIINVYTRDEENRNNHKKTGGVIHRLVRRLYCILHGINVMEKHFEEFHECMPLTKRYFSYKDYINNPEVFDIHLVGSDQVWNLQDGYDNVRFFFLDYIPSESRKISYASSFGTTNIIKDVDKVKSSLQSFESISVREDCAKKLVLSLINRNISQVLDPTLLLDRNVWDKVIPDKPIVKGRYIFFYGVNDDSFTWNVLKKAKRLLGAKIVGYPGPFPPKYPFDKYIYDGGPLQFVNLVKYASLVVTSSYHGLAFSINYEKKVVLVKYGQRMERLESLVRLLGMESCLINNEEELENILNNNAVFAKVCSVLKQERELSLKWICENIK